MPSEKLKCNCKYVTWNIQEEWWKKTLNLARISKVLRLHRYLDCLGESLFLSFSEHFHLLIWLKRKKNSEMKIKTVFIMFLGCLNPKEGNPEVQVLHYKLPERAITFWYCFISPKQQTQTALDNYLLTEWNSDGYQNYFCFYFSLLQKVPNH